MAIINLDSSTSGHSAASEEAAPGPADASQSERPPRPASDTPEALGFTRRDGMVRWMSPRQLAATAMKVAVSSLFGSFSDKREIQAGLPSAGPVDYLGDCDVWVDYVADLGDGFGPTYSVASLLAEDHLSLSCADGTSIKTPRGRALIMGGDQVYPVASIKEYQDRTVGPYRAALPYNPTGPAPHLFAVPGNHDWYDGLTSFMRIFCREQWIGGWETKQRRSYFAVQPRENWWLFGIDIQFDSYIDQPQYEYFEELARTRLQRGDSVVLCSAVPSWAHANRGDDPEGFATLDYFERKIIRENGAHVRLSLAGDCHHYARYEAEDGSQRVTAGGGGAFLSATHNLPDTLVLPVTQSSRVGATTPTAEFKLETTYPSKPESRRLSWRVLALPFRNWSLWALIGTVQLLLAWSMQAVLRSGLSGPSGTDGGTTGPDLPGVAQMTWRLIRAIPFSPLALVLCLVVILGVSGFTKSKTLRIRAAGALHGVLHLVLTFTVIAAASLVLNRLEHGWFVAAFVVLVGVVGGLLGSWLLAMYLLVADRRLGCNANELFAAQRNRDYKNFLRIHFDSAGGVTVYPVKVARTARHWRLRQGGEPHASWLEPDEPDAPLVAELIEEPFIIVPVSTPDEGDREYAVAGSRAH